MLTVGSDLAYSTDWFDYSGTHHTDPIDINCHCYNPQTTQVLNPAAWSLVNNGAWSNNYSTDRTYRGFRVPQENVNFSRNFRIKERVNLTLRVEFANAVNRMRLNKRYLQHRHVLNASHRAAVFPAGQTCGTNVGVKSAGFGSLVVPAAGLGGARTG
jgi:hypothetical protein